jgi:hypothetical protein
VLFNTCRTNGGEPYDWFWIVNQRVFVTSPTQTVISVCEHPDYGEYRVVNCEAGNPAEPVRKFTELYVNRIFYLDPMCAVLAAEPSSWGAIKAIMR